jgi:hypothetical protein
MTKTTKRTSTKTSTVRTSARISKRLNGTGKTSKVAATKKTIVGKKVNAKSNRPEPKKTSRAPTSVQAKSLEVCLLLDCTASMSSWIQRSKDTLAGIIQNVKNDYAGLKVRVSFVGYRDIQDRPRFEILEFSEDLDACTKFIAK